MKCLSVFLMMIFLSGSAVAETNDALSGKTVVYNAYGEEMELAFSLEDRGTEENVVYENYGSLENLNTGDYVYKVTDRKGLSKAVGAGVYPSKSVYRDPAFKMISSAGKLKGSHWDFVNIDNHQLAFYKWATAGETPAVKQFFTGLALEKAGHLHNALKAYHAVILHFPKQVGWSYWHTPIYYPRIAIDRIQILLKKHPELGLRFDDAHVEIKNGFNLTIEDDEYISINPGRFVPVKPSEVIPKPIPTSGLKVVESIGSDHTRVVRFDNGHWQFQVDGKPFMIKAVAYEPTPVGQSAHDGTRKDWMTADLNENGLIDGPYEAWVDKNGNNRQDADELPVGDFQLMKEMGVNTLRHYHGASNNELLREAYDKYGIMAIVGDLMGMYAVGSGAEWYSGTDYTNPGHLKRMEESIRATVMKHKDEPYLLMWMLSNEGNYGEPGNLENKVMGFGSNGKAQHREMYEFANKMARMIKSMDPNHPVAFSNGEVIFVDEFGKIAKDIDIFGANAYRGKDGFGVSFWTDIKTHADKPVLLTEFGCPAFHNYKAAEEAERLQAEYHRGNWEDILYNAAGSGSGSAIGGVAFQYIDEWWKAGPSPEFDPYAQETVGDFVANFPDGWMHEEWLGLVSQGDGSRSPYLRRLRPSYYYYKQAWNQ